MVWEIVTQLYDHNTSITYCSLHASIALYITHIKFTHTVTRLTSTLIKSVRYYKNDYHENKMINYNTCITISTRSRRSYLSIWSIYYPTMTFINVIF